MLRVRQSCLRNGIAALLVILSFAVQSPYSYGKDKKKNDSTTPAVVPNPKNILEGLDLSKIVWPNPPAITRVKYVSYFSGEKYREKKAEKKKSSWMERVAGVATGETPDMKPRFQLLVPTGIATDSKGLVYIADAKVRAIFIVDFETGDFTMIKNGFDARFQWLTGLVVDDSDRLFASDSGMRRVLVFDPQHKVEGSISEGLRDPGGLAIDNENRLLYVTDAEQDLVMVYDADPPYKLLRKLGKPGTNHTSTVAGEFAKPAGVAVDQDGNVYVADTWNDRVEIFDADGQFIRTFGKAGDGPGYFARPKGIAIDSDGHVWVADAVQDRIQVYTPEGRLLLWMGEHGLLPGQFQSLAALSIDKKNRIFSSEIYAGRVQMFRYTTNDEAKAELNRRAEEQKKKYAKPDTTASDAPQKAQDTKAPAGGEEAKAQDTKAAK